MGSVGRLGRRVRVAIVMLLVVASAGSVLPSTVSAQSETPAERAAREIQEARDQANNAADAYFEAESVLQQLEDDLAAKQLEEAQLQITVDELRAQVEVVALARYISSGTQGIPLLTDVTAPQDQVQAEVFTDVLTSTGADTLDLYDAAETALRDKQDEIAERQEEVTAQREQFAALEIAALGEVERLREIEAERLQDEAVQRALEARLAAERAELEERARLDAEAAARAQPNPGLVVPPTTATTVPEVTTPSSNDAASSAEILDDSSSDPDASDGADTTTSTEPPVTEPPVTNPPETTIPTNSGASGGTSGGRTGGGGGGNGPGAVSTGGTFVDAIVCPMPGGAYGDTWGAARSGGRRHEGVDIIAPRGLPIYAVTSGVVTFKFNRLGGNAVSLAGDNGNRYYYAHLDSYVGGSRRVFQGELIGYNGDTGNAQYSTPHLHFQVHPGGGRAVNPYPTVRAAGC
ncbi:MAG: peptidoglycan DD-metalloendopeptidase family protein [Ilumatobacter sp.]